MRLTQVSGPGSLAKASSVVDECQRGAIMIEYVFVIALFTFPVCAAFASLGIPLLRFFRYAQLSLVGPFP